MDTDDVLQGFNHLLQSRPVLMLLYPSFHSNEAQMGSTVWGCSCPQRLWDFGNICSKISKPLPNLEMPGYVWGNSFFCIPQKNLHFALWCLIISMGLHHVGCTQAQTSRRDHRVFNDGENADIATFTIACCLTVCADMKIEPTLSCSLLLSVIL